MFVTQSTVFSMWFTVFRCNNILNSGKSLQTKKETHQRASSHAVFGLEIIKLPMTKMHVFESIN